MIFLRCGRKPPLDLKEFSSSHSLNLARSASDLPEEMGGLLRGVFVAVLGF